MSKKLLKTPHPDANRMVPESRQGVTIASIKNLLPKKTNVAVTEEIVKLINDMEDDTGLPQELMEEDVMSYMHLLGNMRGVGMKDLVNAIKFCNLKRNYDNREAWSIVFPDKYNRLVEMGKQVDNHVSMYNGSKMVVAIDKELLIPVSMQYAPYFHAAVKKQFEIMNGKSTGKDGKVSHGNVSAMVQHLAAKELAVLTKPMEEAKLDITISQSDVMLEAQQDMNDSLAALVQNQATMFAQGKDVGDIQRIHSITVTDVEVVND